MVSWLDFVFKSKKKLDNIVKKYFDRFPVKDGNIHIGNVKLSLSKFGNVLDIFYIPKRESYAILFSSSGNLYLYEIKRSDGSAIYHMSFRAHDKIVFRRENHNFLCFYKLRTRSRPFSRTWSIKIEKFVILNNEHYSWAIYDVYERIDQWTPYTKVIPMYILNSRNIDSGFLYVLFDDSNLKLLKGYSIKDDKIVKHFASNDLIEVSKRVLEHIIDAYGRTLLSHIVHLYLLPRKKLVIAQYYRSLTDKPVKMLIEDRSDLGAGEILKNDLIFPRATY